MDLGSGRRLIMAKTTALTTDWADGVYTFRLPFAQLEEHDEKCGAGPIAVLGALVDGTFRIPYIRETIRLGLIGGGKTPAEALKLIRRYVDDRPVVESLPFAVAILGAAVRGEDEDEKPGKQEAPKPSTDPIGSTSTLSEETPASWGSVEPNSPECPSTS